MTDLRARRTAAEPSPPIATGSSAEAAAEDAASSHQDQSPKQSVASSTASTSSPSCIRGCFRVFSFLLVFLAIFIGISLVTTGTVHYGVAPQASWAGSMRYVKYIAAHLPSVFSSSSRLRVGASRAGIQKRPPATPQEPLVVTPPNPRDPTALYLTLDELSEHTGANGDTILLAVHGRIFDVTSGRSFYGPGAGYSNLAGKDASRAFATNCYNNRDLHDQRGLTEEQRLAIDGWYNFYLNHHTYQPVGWVVIPEIPPEAPLPNDTC